MAEEHLHWADQIAREVKERVEKTPLLQKVVKKNGYIVYDEKTPSGEIHIGSGRGWIIHDAIARAMRDLGLKAKFVLSSDDIDPFDKMPSYLDKSFEKYLGMPFRNIPSPVEGYESYADYYFMQCVEKFEEYGIDAEIESTGARYEAGDFNAAIKKILDNADKIKAIFERMYKKPYDRLPFNPICENCGKIGTTRAISWDKKKELVTYACEKDFVEWAKGCGHKGEISPYDGNGKLPWKVEWAAKWPTVGVVCEYAGKDHFSAGGARQASITIASEVLKFPPPYPSTDKYTGKGYEFFNVGGEKMSTSKGKGIAFYEISKFVPAKILRYLLVRTRPTAVIDFDPTRPNDLIFLYDRYDQTEKIYFGEEEADERETANQKRIYELTHVTSIADQMPTQISLVHAAIAMQAGLGEEGALSILKRTGHVHEEIDGIELHSVMQRLHDAKQWVEKFAPEQYQFKVQEKAVVKGLSTKQKEALKVLAEKLAKEKWEEKKLHDEFYNICKGIDLDVKDFFKAAYKVLINKEKGPRLASFILTLGQEKVAELFGKK